MESAAVLSVDLVFAKCLPPKQFEYQSLLNFAHLKTIALEGPWALQASVP